MTIKILATGINTIQENYLALLTDQATTASRNCKNWKIYPPEIRCRALKFGHDVDSHSECFQCVQKVFNFTLTTQHKMTASGNRNR